MTILLIFRLYGTQQQRLNPFLELLLALNYCLMMIIKSIVVVTEKNNKRKKNGENDSILST